jgi:hypothetical protein
MIEMTMRYENVDVSYFSVFGKLDAKLPQSSSGIEDDNMFTAANFDAWRIAAITDRRGTRAGNASSDSPEPDPH